MAVRAGSVAAALLPEAATWRDEHDLAELLAAPGALPAAATRPARRTAAVFPSVGSTAVSPRAERVSVGVPVYRDVRFLDECLTSILAQTRRPHEVLVVDDGSRSREVDAALARWEGAEGLVRVLRQPNAGVCVARNRLLDEMTGDAFVLVDQDDVLLPEFIEATASLLRRRPEVWAAATWTEFFGAYEGVEAKPPFDRRTGRRENTIISTGALVDMRVRDLGLRFAPDLAFLYCEDWHFWSQIVAAGGVVGLVPEVLVRHRVHPSSGGFRRTELAWHAGRRRAIEPMLGDPCRR
ncbi:MAG TPA: glycosyltransferase family 2 protein [Actinobacteria bacterium]|nr:glycosyltransferase family 2 protein [Actinomycetota bacterium]